jgi:guanosine-3',5'-bis(diphosphate) 3'-pyrophosphohydrolase
MNTVIKLVEAASFAAQKHTGHHRKGDAKEPYINHPLEVANLLANVGAVDDIDVLIAAILHDTVEDVGVTKDEIAERFGDRVAGIVMEVTDDKSLPKAERKRLQVEHAPHLTREAKLVKLGDKISNIRDVINNPPSDWETQRRKEYVDWGEAVVAGLRGANDGLERSFHETVERARKELS